MATSEFTKAEKKALRELAEAIYEAEAHVMLEELDASFSEWREGEMLSSELLAAINEFHQNESRDLWSKYQALKEDEIVARGLALGLVSKELPEQLQAKLEPLIEFFARHQR